jgi:hypothetical protein
MEDQKKLNLKVTIPLVVILLLALSFFGLIIYGRQTGTATLSWTVNLESDLAGYKIYYGTSKRTGDCPPAGYTSKLDVGRTATPDKPNYKIENLSEGKTYYFSVTSYDKSNNESCFSPEMSKTINKLN